MTDFPAAEPHGPIEEVWDGVFWVRGSIRMGPGMRIPRNMIVIRDGKNLSVVSAVRLSAEGEAALSKLGAVRNVLKIGMHQMDDAYYVDRYGATYWALPGAVKDGGLAHEPLSDDNAPPDTDMQVFVFRDTKMPEAALLVPRDRGILVTCDSVQNWTDLEGCSFPARLVTRMMGFFHPMNIGPPWRKFMTKPGGTLRADFDRLAELPFDHCLGGHGAPANGNAKAGLRTTIDRVFS